jgi:NADH-quinone oxidoreductase subunit I
VVSTVPLALARRRSGLRAYGANIVHSAVSIFEGLTVTMSWLFRRPATIQYPDRIEKPVQEMLPDGYRGILEVDLLRCSGCLLCMRACPIGVITVETAKNAETSVREIVRFDIDIGLCMFCGLCVEACQYDAIDHTTEFEATMPCVEALTLRFVKTPTPTSRFKKGEGPARRPKGTILRETIPDYGRRRGANRWAGNRPAPVAQEGRSDG